jgi:hypothetical protein
MAERANSGGKFLTCRPKLSGCVCLLRAIIVLSVLVVFLSATVVHYDESPLLPSASVSLHNAHAPSLSERPGVCRRTNAFADSSV